MFYLMDLNFDEVKNGQVGFRQVVWLQCSSQGRRPKEFSIPNGLRRSLQRTLCSSIGLSLTLTSRTGRRVPVTCILGWETHRCLHLHDRSSHLVDLVPQGCMGKWPWQQGVSPGGVNHLHKLRQKFSHSRFFCSSVPLFKTAQPKQHYFFMQDTSKALRA